MSICSPRVGSLSSSQSRRSSPWRPGCLTGRHSNVRPLAARNLNWSLRSRLRGRGHAQLQTRAGLNDGVRDASIQPPQPTRTRTSWQPQRVGVAPSWSLVGREEPTTESCARQRAGGATEGRCAYAHVDHRMRRTYQRVTSSCSSATRASKSRRSDRGWVPVRVNFSCEESPKGLCERPALAPAACTGGPCCCRGQPLRLSAPVLCSVRFCPCSGLCLGCPLARGVCCLFMNVV